MGSAIVPPVQGTLDVSDLKQAAGIGGAGGHDRHYRHVGDGRGCTEAAISDD